MSLISLPLVIGGTLVETTRKAAIVDPATEQVFAQVCVAGEDDLGLAVEAAQRAYTSWSGKSWEERSQVLLAYADKIEEGVDELARTLVLEQGKPLASAKAEIASGLKFLRAFARMRLEEYAMDEMAGRRVTVKRVPLGVVGAICPWNYPVLIALWKLAPALIAGNTIVIKPAPTTPLTSLWLGRTSKGILPDGVINVLSGDDDLGPWMTSHPGIRKISFTGSSAVGRKVMRSAADDLKRITLELGGNDPGILLPDLNVEANARSLFNSAFANNGQVCVALKRMIVHRDIHDRVIDALRREASKLRFGHGLHAETTAGPVQNRRQYEKVKRLIDAADRFGHVAYRGPTHDGPGYFLPMTIVTDVDTQSELWREEPFGPILPVVQYDEIDQAIALANDDAYGLGASVWSSDPKAAEAVCHRLEAGTVWTNTHPAMSPGVPLAGVKQSGFGIEFGIEGLTEFTDLRVLNFEASAMP